MIQSNLSELIEEAKSIGFNSIFFRYTNLIKNKDAQYLWMCEFNKWISDNHNIDVYVIPVFRDKCGYDSFKRDGYTFEVMIIEPCQHLDWTTLNMCGEDRDEEKELESIDKALRPSVPSLELALEIGLSNACKIIKNKL